MDMEIMEEVKDELTEEVEEEFKEEVKEVSEKGNKSSVKEEPKFRYFEVMLVGSVNVGKTKIFNQISKLPGKDRPTIGVESRFSLNSY
jgi:tRNA U34 5-carboxymethylaminomethyl modifying GTPase MnmE/TrmE